MGPYVTPGSVYCLLCGLEKLLYLSGSQGTHLLVDWIRLGESEENMVLRWHRVAPVAKFRDHLCPEQNDALSLSLSQPKATRQPEGPLRWPHENIWKQLYPPP